jgi:hypothetical protein
VGRLSPNSTNGSSQLVTTKDIRLSPKIGFKTLNKEEEVVTTIRSTTNGGTTTRILVLKSEPRYSISESSKERAMSGELQNPNPCCEVKSVVIHIYFFKHCIRKENKNFIIASKTLSPI